MNAPVGTLAHLTLPHVAPPEPHCSACQASLFGDLVACDFHRELHAQRLRAEASRASKPQAAARKRDAEARTIERRLARLAAERRRRRRLSLTHDDVWTGGVSSVYGMGDA